MRRLTSLAFSAALVSATGWPAAAQAAQAVPAAAASPRLEGAARFADSVQRLVETARLTASFELLAEARALAERALAVYPDDALLLLYQGYALTQEVGVRLGRRGGDTGPLLEAAEQALERSVERRPTPEGHALLASVYGMKIGSNPLRGMTLGPRSGRAMERALELGPDNPRVFLARGIGAINTPAMFGGGLDRAQEFLLRATRLFEQDQPVPPAPAWGRADAYAWLGQVYRRQNRVDQARAAFDRALALEPENRWYQQLRAALDRDH